MATQFDDWLQQLAAARKGPVQFPAATRGRLWRQNIILPGDWMAAAMRAQIRLYPDAPGEPLVECIINGPYSEDGGTRTIFQLLLVAGTGSGSTGSLPADSDLDGVTQFAMDVMLKENSSEPEDLLFGGVFTLLGRVTA